MLLPGPTFSNWVGGGRTFVSLYSAALEPFRTLVVWVTALFSAAGTLLSGCLELVLDALGLDCEVVEEREEGSSKEVGCCIPDCEGCVGGGGGPPTTI